MKDEYITGALQENLLTLLCFDTEAAKIISAAVTPNLFDTKEFREVAATALSFLSQFNEAIKEHLADSLEPKLNSDNKREAAHYKRLLDNLYAAQDSINREYVIQQLNKFVRQQNIKAGIMRAVESIEQGNVDEAEVALTKALNTQVVTFEEGTTFTDTKESLRFLEQIENPYLTGVEELDRRGIGPMRKELFTFIAPTGKGKTWFLVHIGKWLILQRVPVLHISLEMSEVRVAQRYVQSFFSITRREGEIAVPHMQRDRDGEMEDVFYEKMVRTSLEDPNIRKYLSQRIQRRFRKSPSLTIKNFPTSKLTIPQLEAYLDGLERHKKVTPGALIVDYPELMALDPSNKRIELGQLVKQLRGIGVERNMAVIIAAQGNRDSTNSKTVRGNQIGEAFSIVQDSDVALTYSQTDQEKRMGLARLSPDKVRNEGEGSQILVSQSYAIGQFAVDSAPMRDEYYWKFLEDGVRAD